MKRILLVSTINALNFGAALQLAASSRILSRYGEVRVLDYTNPVIESSMKHFRSDLSIRGVFRLIKNILRIGPKTRAINNFRKFYEANLFLTEKYDRQTLCSSSWNYDAAVAGSDQIWNPDCVSSDGQIDKTYFLDFLPKGTCKISYSSSLGGYVPGESYLSSVRPILTTFSGVSVRETSMVPHLSQVYSGEVVELLDPTLYLSAETWRTFIAPSGPSSQADKEYILVYSLQRKRNLVRSAKKISKMTGTQIYIIDHEPFPFFACEKHINISGPSEFMSLIAHAKYVITDSFHGVCFSLIFSTPFVAVSSPYHDERLKSLFGNVGLIQSLHYSDETVSLEAFAIDFHSVHEKLEILNKRTEAFLNEYLAD